MNQSDPLVWYESVSPFRRIRSKKSNPEATCDRKKSEDTPVIQGSCRLRVLCLKLPDTRTL